MGPCGSVQMTAGIMSAFLAALENHRVLKTRTGAETSINELFRMLATLIGSASKEVHGPAKKGEQLRSLVDPAKIRQQLGWDVKVDLAEGLKRTVAYFKEQSS